MTLIGKTADFENEQSYALNLNNKNLLLIKHQQSYYLIENKCGHFGVSLDDASIKNNEIICTQHGISFCLKTGAIINRPYENCNPIKTYQIRIKDLSIYCTDLND